MEEDNLVVDYSAREQAYKDYFGMAWEDIIDLWMVENKPPEDAEVILEEAGILDYCDRCKNYYILRDNRSCPYCGNRSSYED